MQIQEEDLQTGKLTGNSRLPTSLLYLYTSAVCIKGPLMLIRPLSELPEAGLDLP